MGEYYPDLALKTMKTVAVSGYFDPPHAGHVALFEEAKKLGDVLIVIVNNDAQQKLKGSVPFMRLAERVTLLQALKPVDMVVVSVDKDPTVCKTLEAVRPDIFANGGDRCEGNVPESSVCETLGIKMVYGVGGGKINSSSKLIYEAAKTLGVVPNSGTAPIFMDKDYQGGGGAENKPTITLGSYGVASCDCSSEPETPLV